MIVFSKFVFPANLTDKQKIIFCQEIIEKFKKEAKLLRKAKTKAEGISSKLEKEKEKLIQQINNQLKINGNLKKEIDRLKKEQDSLRKEIERLTKTNKRYQASLFDHGNFKHQDENLGKKPKGGQLGHEDTNRENQVGTESYASFPKKRIYAKVCACCGTSLKRVTSFKQKILLDIILNPQIVKLIIESERQWCGKCHKEVVAKDPQSLPFTEYGLNTFMLVLILRFKGHLSLGSISSIFQIAFGLTLSKSDAANLLKQASCYLGPKYQELLEAVRKGEIIYADETGWQVKGQPAWMWIMATEDTTVYFAAESRGKGIAQELYGDSDSPTMTDGLASYLKIISSDKHLYCWAHMLRFAFEETVNCSKDSLSIFLRDGLVRVYHLKFNHPEFTKQELENILRKDLDKLLNLTSEEESFLKIHHRLKEQKEGLILALLKTKDGTNNLAERELRPMVLNKKVSFGSDTYTGMEVSAKLGSIIQTLGRQKADLLTEVSLNLQIGIHQKYSQYQHLSYQDT